MAIPRDSTPAPTDIAEQTGSGQLNDVRALQIGLRL
jgi:hypothetical protein